MSRVFYRSSTDGWRIGVAEVGNTNKVLVVDDRIHVQETCRMSDIYVPTVSGKGHAPETNLLEIERHPQEFLDKTDAALMEPTPLVALPAVIELLRQRWAAQRPFVSIGDNVDVLLHHRLAQMESALDTSPLPTAIAKVVASFRASASPQMLVGSGRIHEGFAAAAAELMLKDVRASPLLISRVTAALQVITAFTTTISGKKPVVQRVAIDFGSQQDQSDGRGAPSSVTIDHQLLDLSHFSATSGGCEDNFRIFAMLIYAFNHEEKERVYINRKQTDFSTQRVVKSLDAIGDIRRWYVDFGKAMDTLGIEFPYRLSLLSRVAVALHLQEIDFFEDGSPSNLTALKAVARLLQVDFNAATRVFVNKDQCIAAAKWIYESTVVALVDKINVALGTCFVGNAASSGGEESSAGKVSPGITILSVPPPPEPELASAVLQPYHLSLSSLYEDLAQCLFRTTELESIAWQRAGLIAPDALQAILDSADNYSILKLLKGKGGVLQCAQLSTAVAYGEHEHESAAPARSIIESLTKAKLLHCLPSELKVTVPHTFGARTYQFCNPPTSVGPSLDTIYVDRYQTVRDFLFTQSDVDTQEVLHLLDQRRERHTNRLGADAASMQSVMDQLQSEVSAFWWVRGVELEAGFQGDVVEEQLRMNALLPIIKLRQLFPKRYVVCNPSFVIGTFKKLLPADKSGLEPLQQAETILSLTRTNYLVTPELKFLIEGRMLVQLDNYYKGHLSSCATVIQAFARLHTTGKLIRARFLSWREAVSELESQRDHVVTKHRAYVENTELHKLQRYELVEQEATHRVVLRDQYWVEWVALQTSAQQEMQSILQKLVARSIRKEESVIKKTAAQTHRRAVHQLTQRIQEHLLSQGSHLDEVIERKEQQHAAAYRRLEREYETHKKLMAKKLEEEESKLEKKQAIAAKQERALKVALQREQHREELRQKIWFRHEKDRVAREQISKTRELITSTLEEQIAFEQIERTMAKRVAEEVAEEQKRLRAEQAAAIKAAKMQREEELIAAAKANERQIVRKEIQQQKRIDGEMARRRKLEQELLLSQERERRAMERMKKEQEKHQKTLTRSLLKAHEMLQSPILFEHTTDGAVQLVKQQRSLSPSAKNTFLLSTGKETHPRLLSPSVAAGLLGVAPRVGSAAGASPSPLRHASPRSNFSI